MNKILIVILILIIGTAGYLVFRNSQKPVALPEEPLEEITTEIQAETVSIEGFAFKPALLQIKTGTIVTWTNNDAAPHTVTGSGLFGSGTLAKGQSFSYTFDQAGDYSYICNLHPSMKGTVEVRD